MNNTNIDWRAMLKKMRLENIRQTAPNFFEASGGFDMAVPAYSDSTTNGLTKTIIDFLTFSGHWASRVNTQGQARVKNIPRYSLLSGKVENSQKVSFTKSTTKRGTPDISAIIKGHAVQIEVKVGRDSMSEHQEKEQIRIENAGGSYFIARDMPGFLSWYEKMFSSPKPSH